MINLWEKLEKILKQKNISRYQLSKMTGVAQTTLSSYKYGVEPSFKNVCKIADALGVSLDYFREEDNHESNKGNR